MKNAVNANAAGVIALGEEVLGENLQWLYDQLDPQIRRGDRDAARRLGRINSLWQALARAKAASAAAPGREGGGQ